MTQSTFSSLNQSLSSRPFNWAQNRKKSGSKASKFYIKGYNGSEIVEGILAKRGWIKLEQHNCENFNLAWTELSTQINFFSLKPSTQLVNHIPNNTILTNKLGLLQSLRDYETYCTNIEILKKFKMDDFTPKTFIVDDARERYEFFNTFKSGDIWICKPIGGNQGKGITLIRDIEKFKTGLMDKNIMHKTMLSLQPKIAQRYITNPLLIEGRKFDIRCYMLIASTIPYLVLFYPGYIRLSINKYSNTDENLITHLTNQFIQKQSPKYDSVKDSTIWSIDKFNDYFNENYTHLNNFKENWVIQDLTENIKDILLHVFKSVRNKLANSVSFFELYGLDFMVDENLKTWLIEANSNPSMCSSCTLLKELIPELIEEVLSIALECFEKNTKLNQPLLPLQNMNKFQVIYCENLEISKLRKSNQTHFKTRNEPKLNPSSVPDKMPLVSKYTGKPTVPLPTSFSLFTKPNRNDVWIDRWNKMNSFERLSMSESRPSQFPTRMHRSHENMLNSSVPQQRSALSGDLKTRSESIQTSLDLM